MSIVFDSYRVWAVDVLHAVGMNIRFNPRAQTVMVVKGQTMLKHRAERKLFMNLKVEI